MIPETPARTTARQRSIAILLGVGVLVNYFDRVNLTVAHDALEKSFGVSDVAFGYLLSSYSWTYAVMQLPSGALLDRFGVRRVMLVAILIWAAASGMAAIAGTLMVFFLARLLLGIGEAPTFPANAKAVGLWFPESVRGIPTATFDAAAKLGIGLGTPLLGFVLLRYGVRANFGLTALLSLGFAALFWVVYRDPEKAEKQAEAQAPHVRLADVLRQRKVLGAALGSGAYNYTFYLLLTWMPIYLKRGLKMSAQAAVLWSAVPWVFAAACGFLVGGVLVDRAIRRGTDSSYVRKAVLVGGTACGLLVLAPAAWPVAWPTPAASTAVVLACLSLALGGLAATSPVLWTLPNLLAEPGASGRVGGAINLANQIAAIAAPIVTGYLSVWTHSFKAAFAVAAVVLLLGITGYISLLGRIERVVLATP